MNFFKLVTFLVAGFITKTILGSTFLIVSPVVVTPTLLSSAIFTGPAMEIAVEEVNEIYGNFFNLSLHLLQSPRMPDCMGLLFNVQDVLSEYLFQHRRTAPHQQIAAILAPGCLESYEDTQTGRFFDLLVIMSVATDIRSLNKAKFGNVIMSSSLIQDYYMLAPIELLKRHGWTAVFIVYDTEGSAYAAAIGLVQALLHYMATDKRFTAYSRGVDPSEKVTDYGAALQDVRNHSRAVLFVGHALNLRKFMISAWTSNMTGGDYIFLGISPFEYPHPEFGNFTWQNYDGDDQVAFEAYKVLLLIRPASTDINSAKRVSFFHAMIQRTKKEYNYTYTRRLNITEQPSPFTISSYASVYVLAQVLNDSLNDQPLDSAGLASRIWNRCFLTPLGEFCFDDLGQRQIELEITQLNTSTGSLDRQIFFLEKHNRTLISSQRIVWFPGSIWPVPNIPICGYLGLTGPCEDDSVRYVVSWSVGMSLCLISLTAAVVIFIKRKIKNAAKMHSHRWELELSHLRKSFDGDDIDPYCRPGRRSTAASIIGATLNHLPQFRRTQRNIGVTLTMTGKATFKDRPVWIKSYQIPAPKGYTPGKKYHRTLSYLHELQHPNLAVFIGIVPNAELNVTLLVNEWCSRGNVCEMLDGTKIQIDWNIRSSLIGDLVQGLKFIHQSSFKLHGNMSPQVCLVDSQLTLKISELGYLEILALGFGSAATQLIVNTERGKNKPHLAYEAATTSGFRATAEADVYAAGKIMQGIVSDFGVAKAAGTLNIANCPEKLLTQIALCLNVNPKLRPTASQLVHRLARNGSRLLEKILRRMEAYAQELEDAVLLRTLELEAEQQKCDMLLLEMIPLDVVHKLRLGLPVEPELFQSVSLSFSSLVGFVEFVTVSTPLDVITLLNDSHGLFDQIIEGHSVYKIETIGDSYFLASGLPVRNGDKHASELCCCGVELRAAFIAKYDPKVLQVRTGINSGPCVAAVVGLKMPRYCLFGDTVNTASRMESYGEPSKVHLSRATVTLLEKSADRSFVLYSRGLIDIKGKGEMETFWLEPCPEIIIH